jgi:hypothetical protein
LSGDDFNGSEFFGFGDCCRDDGIGANASSSYVACDGHDMCRYGNNTNDEYYVMLQVVTVVIVFSFCAD